jgi:very-short-patch-repair endonuclease
MATPARDERRVSCAPRKEPASRAVAELAAEQWGIVDLDELRGCGLSPREITTLVQNGWLHRLHRRVYSVGHASPPLEGRFLGAVKACVPPAAISFFAGAVNLGIFDWEERPIDVTVAAVGSRSHPGLRIHRVAAFGPDDVCRHRGIPTTSPARTLLDLAAVLPPNGLRRAVRRAQSLGLVHVDQITAYLGRHEGRRGAGRLARLIATGPAPTRSELEDAVLDLMLRGGLAHPRVNEPLRLGGRRVIPDFRWPELRLVVEADGAQWHEGAVAREVDSERQALLEAHGERVLRVTWAQAVTEPHQTLARLRAAGAPRARTLSGT